MTDVAMNSCWLLLLVSVAVVAGVVAVVAVIAVAVAIVAAAVAVVAATPTA